LGTPPDRVDKAQEACQGGQPGSDMDKIGVSDMWAPREEVPDAMGWTGRCGRAEEGLEGVSYGESVCGCRVV